MSALVEAAGLAFCCAAGGFSTALRLCCCATRAAGNSVKSVPVRVAKVGYLLIIFITAILALVLFRYGSEIKFLQDVKVLADVCTAKGTEVSQCFGVGAVLRLSFGLTMFFLAMGFTVISPNTFVGCWFFKILAWLGCLMASFFVPSTNIAQFARASQVCSILFLIAMVILLIDAAYHVQEFISAKLDDAEAGRSSRGGVWKGVYLFVSLGGVVASITGIALLFKFSTSQADPCHQNISFLSVTLAAGLLGLVLSPLSCLGAGRGILAPSIVFAYTTWLCWSAISSQSDDNCNPNPTNNSGTSASVVGMIMAALSLAYTALSASRSLPGLAASHKKEEGGEDAGGQDEESAAGYHRLGAGKGGDDEDSRRRFSTNGDVSEATPLRPNPSKPVGVVYTRSSALVFILIMVLASLYLGMVLSNWSVSPDEAQPKSDVTMWMQIASQWATMILYLWTLIAPALCPNREFA